MGCVGVKGLKSKEERNHLIRMNQKCSDRSKHITPEREIKIGQNKFDIR